MLELSKVVESLVFRVIIKIDRFFYLIKANTGDTPCQHIVQTPYKSDN